MEQWKKAAWSDESQFLLNQVDGRVRVHFLSGKIMATGCTMGRRPVTIALAYQLVFLISIHPFKPFGTNCTDGSCTIRPGTIFDI